MMMSLTSATLTDVRCFREPVHPQQNKAKTKKDYHDMNQMLHPKLAPPTFEPPQKHC